MNRPPSSVFSTAGAAMRAGSRPGAALLLLVAVMVQVGCASPGPYATLADANGAYQRGDYMQAYAFASAISNDGPSLDQFEAAYIAGLAATQLGEDAKAVKQLKRATRAYDKQMASDAGVMLGLAYARQGKNAEAAETLIAAAPGQSGEAQAKAWFHAADAQQRLGRWASARDYLLLAKARTHDASLVAAIEERLAVNGFTLEIGSYADLANAEAAAEKYDAVAKEIGLKGTRMVEDPARAGRVRVHVGEFSTFASAASYREQLGLPNAFRGAAHGAVTARRRARIRKAGRSPAFSTAAAGRPPDPLQRIDTG